MDIGNEYCYIIPPEILGIQKRRLAISDILAMNFRALILDNPAAGPDPESKHIVVVTVSIFNI